jgi:hypothetical protein
MFGRRGRPGRDSLLSLQRELTAARADAAVTREQLTSLREDADEAQVRSLVTENSGDVRDARQAAGHAERLERQLRRTSAQIAELEERERAMLAPGAGA